MLTPKQCIQEHACGSKSRQCIFGSSLTCSCVCTANVPASTSMSCLSAAQRWRQTQKIAAQHFSSHLNKPMYLYALDLWTKVGGTVATAQCYLQVKSQATLPASIATDSMAQPHPHDPSSQDLTDSRRNQWLPVPLKSLWEQRGDRAATDWHTAASSEDSLNTTFTFFT